MYTREKYHLLQQRLNEKRKFIQVVLGPRQVGKTTLVQQVLQSLELPFHYASADETGLISNTWIEVQWNIGRQKCKETAAVLVLDEMQKIPQWSTTVKKMWDEDTQHKIPLKVVLLGSSSLLVQKGLQESMAGRFEVIPLTHWSFKEMRDAFGWNVKQYIYFGGYPGAASLIADEQRWVDYILNSLIETTISRDILLLNPVYKPALLRELFHLGCAYSGQILSLNKMLGQLQDAGNTTTLSHYLNLLGGAGVLVGLHKYAGRINIQRASSPKFQVLNNAFLSTQIGYDFVAAQKHHEIWGRLVESAIGAHLYNSTLGSNWQVCYWRQGNFEVDFVLKNGKNIVAFEVKSTNKNAILTGMAEFKKIYKNSKLLLIGDSGIGLEEFLQEPLLFWL